MPNSGQQTPSGENWFATCSWFLEWKDFGSTKSDRLQETNIVMVVGETSEKKFLWPPVMCDEVVISAVVSEREPGGQLKVSPFRYVQVA